MLSLNTFFILNIIFKSSYVTLVKKLLFEFDPNNCHSVDFARNTSRPQTFRAIIRVPIEVNAIFFNLQAI